jgi:hypothetical protein
MPAVVIVAMALMNGVEAGSLSSMKTPQQNLKAVCYTLWRE